MSPRLTQWTFRFLHASFQVDALRKCLSAREVRDVLETFPSDLEELYTRAWNRILERNPDHVSLARCVLVWVLNAARPMSPEELECAVATSLQTFKFESDTLVHGMSLVSLCRGLLTFENESRVIRLVRACTKFPSMSSTHHLLDYTVKDTLQGLLQGSFPHPHSHIATVCMAHLTECGFTNTTIPSEEKFTAALDTDPLLAYASDSWAIHARESLDIEDAKNRTAKFVADCKAFPTNHSWGFDILSSLHILAVYGLPISCIPYDSIRNPNIVTQMEQATPLMLATWHGHEDLVRFLLAHSKILVNLVDADGWSALMRAAGSGHEGIASLLLVCPDLQVNLVSTKGWSALGLAALSGYDAIVKLVLTRSDIQVNLVNHVVGAELSLSALMAAAVGGHESVVQLLLARPETQVNLLCGDKKLSALMLAATRDDKGVVKRLLSHSDVQVNLVNGYGQSALMLAVAGGHEGNVELLLSHPDIQVNPVQNVFIGSALASAAVHGFEGIVRILLDHPDTEVNLANDGWTVLMDAAFRGQEGVVRLLVAHPAIQVNLVNHEGWSALMQAVFGGHGGIVNLLLAHPKIQVNLVNDYRQTAFALAAGGGHVDMVKSFLALPDTQVNLVDDLGQSALMVAARNGYKGVVELLLAHPSIETNLVNNRGWSALMLAVLKDRQDIVKLFLAHHQSRRASSREFPSESDVTASPAVPGRVGWIEIVTNPLQLWWR